MKEYVIAAVVILVVLGVGYVSVIEFQVAKTVQYGLVFIALLIAIVLAYTWMSSRKLPAKQKSPKKIKLIRIKDEYNKTLKLVEEAGKLADVDRAVHGIKLMHNDLKSLKCFTPNLEINEENIEEYSLTFLEQKCREVESKLKDVEVTAATSYEQGLIRYANNFSSKLDELQRVGYDIGQYFDEFKMLMEKPTRSLEEMIGKKEEIFTKFIATLKFCIEDADNLARVGRQYGDTTHIDQIISDAKNNINNFDNCVYLLIRVRKEFGPGVPFDKLHKQLVDSVNQVVKFLGSEFIPVENKRNMKELADHIYSLTDAGQIVALQTLEQKFKESTAELIFTLNKKITEMESNIFKHNVPSNLWTPDKKIQKLVNDISPTEEISTFTKKASRALTQLISQIELDETITEILDNYQKIEVIISKKLNEKGQLTAEDLGIYHPEKFFVLYKINHPDVDFVESPPTLFLKEKSRIEIKIKKADTPYERLEQECEEEKDYIVQEMLKNNFIKKQLNEAFQKGYIVPADIEQIAEKKYIPCILLYYAEQNGHGLAVESDEVILYDKKEVENRLENVINNLLEPKFNKEYEYAKIKDPLEMPLPESEIKKIIRKLKVEKRLIYSIDIKDNYIAFKEGV